MFRIAIPDSSLSEQASLLKKCVKLGSIARACGIFCVDRIYIYRDERGKFEADAELAKLFLEYLETPQYLRKKLFGIDRRLRYVGMIPPLKLPHHKPKVPIEEVRVGEFREGVVISSGKDSLVDVGLDSPVLVRRKLGEGRVTVRIERKEPLIGSIAKAEGYWGYRVKLVGSLPKLLNSIGRHIVITSRKGRDVREQFEELKRLSGPITLIFGSPRRGVWEILRDYGKSPLDFTDYIVNMFPRQCVETVRLEEAIVGSLSILNALVKLNKRTSI